MVFSGWWDYGELLTILRTFLKWMLLQAYVSFVIRKAIKWTHCSSFPDVSLQVNKHFKAYFAFLQGKKSLCIASWSKLVHIETLLGAGSISILHLVQGYYIHRLYLEYVTNHKLEMCSTLLLNKQTDWPWNSSCCPDI